MLYNKKKFIVMPGHRTEIRLTEEMIIFNNTIPSHTALVVFNHGENTKIHYKQDGKVTRIILPIPREQVEKILAKKSA